MDIPKFFFSWKYRNIKLIKTNFGCFNKILFDLNNFVGSIYQIVQFTKKFGWNNQKFKWIYPNLLSKSESVKFSLIEPVICIFSDTSVQKYSLIESMKKYLSLLNQLIFTEVISEI